VERELFKSYKLHNDYEAKVGEKMILLKYGKAYKIFQAKEDYSSDDTKYPKILKNEPWVAWFARKNDCILLKGAGNWRAFRTIGWYYDWGLRLENCNKLKENPWVAVYINTRDIYSVDYAETKKRNKSWSKDKLDIFQQMDEKYYAADDLFISELVYTGKEKETVFLHYREYTGAGLARSPFFQQLRYDIEKTSIIKFKSLSIEVLNATNESILFRILSDENVPWMRID